MVRCGSISALLALALTGGVAHGEPGRAVIVDVAATAESRGEVDRLRSALERDGRPLASEPDIRSALERQKASSEDLSAGEAALKKATGSLADFAIDRALGELRVAQKLAVAALANDTKGALSLLANVHFVWGQVLDTGGKPGAIDQFRATRRLDPSRSGIDPGTYKPSLVKLYAKAASSASSGRARALISGDPSVATLTIDGRDAGSLPATVGSLADGPHYVVVRSAGYKPAAYLLEVAGTTRLVVALEAESRAEKLQTLRSALAKDPTNVGALASIAEASAAATVVVVRENAGAIEAAVYERDGVMSAFSPPGALTFRATTAVAETTPPPADDTSPLIDGGAGSEARPWYLTWKGAAAAGAAAAVITVAAVLLLGGDKQFEVGGVCQGAEC